MEIDVYVVSKETQGHLVLSRKNAKMMQAWDKIVDAYNNETVVTGNIVSKTKGGLIVEVFGLETFLPGSQIDVKQITDYDSYVGKKMEIQSGQDQRGHQECCGISQSAHRKRYRISASGDHLQTGERSGTGRYHQEHHRLRCLHRSGWCGWPAVHHRYFLGRINHPNEVLELNQKLNVVVLDFDDNKKRISLGLKQLTPHPWDVLDASIDAGNKVTGKIVNIEDYGAFLEISPGIEGLIHVSEVSWSNQPINSKEFFKLNDTYEAMVVTIDREDHKMSLSLETAEC